MRKEETLGKKSDDDVLMIYLEVRVPEFSNNILKVYTLLFPFPTSPPSLLRVAVILCGLAFAVSTTTLPVAAIFPRISATVAGIMIIGECVAQRPKRATDFI